MISSPICSPRFSAQRSVLCPLEDEGKSVRHDDQGGGVPLGYSWAGRGHPRGGRGQRGSHLVEVDVAV